MDIIRTNKINKVFIAKILIVALFFVTSIKGFYNFDNFVNIVRSKNLPFPTFIALIALLIKLVGSLMVILNVYPKLGTYSLIIFTIIATILYHNIFVEINQLNAMLKNISIIGGLILLT